MTKALEILIDFEERYAMHFGAEPLVRTLRLNTSIGRGSLEETWREDHEKVKEAIAELRSHQAQANAQQ